MTKLYKSILVPVAILLNCACEPSNRTDLKGFKPLGNAAVISLNQLPAQVLARLKDPSSVKNTVEEGISSFWAGYTDRQNVSGEADSTCKRKDDDVYCDRGQSTMRAVMYAPFIFPVGANAVYALIAAARSLKIIDDAADRSTSHDETVRIEKLDGVSSTIATNSRSDRDVYVIKVVNTKKRTKRSLSLAYYLASDGSLIGVAARQEQPYNDQIQVQTAEWHLPKSGQGRSKMPQTFSLADEKPLSH